MMERVPPSHQSVSILGDIGVKKNRLEKEGAKVRAKLVRQLEDICSSFKSSFFCFFRCETQNSFKGLSQ